LLNQCWLLDASCNGSEPGAVVEVPGNEVVESPEPGYSLNHFRWDLTPAVQNSANFVIEEIISLLSLIQFVIKNIEGQTVVCPDFYAPS
jgi:Ni,Fe-hydrogenase maturation factor